MSNVLAWIKSNVVIVACLVVMVLAMVSLLWPTGSANAEFQQQLDTRPRQLNKINQAISHPVTIPAQDPNAPPLTERFTVNEASVKKLQQIFHRMNSSYNLLYKDAATFNQNGPSGNNPHKPMINSLFDVLNPSDVTRIQAVGAYKRAVKQLYTMPLLHAGMPPTSAEIKMLLDQVEQRFVAAYLGAAGPNAKSDPELIRQQAEAQRDLIIRRAKSIGVYMRPPGADTASALANTGDNSPGLQTTTLLNMSTTPDMALLWESQMQLWIQQDLLYAVAMTNHSAAAPPPATADDSGNPAATSSSPSVLSAPVKRILALTVKPGYVTGSSAAAAAAMSPTGIPGTTQPEENINQRLTDNFVVSPTGRRSNPLYDVRMATLSVLIDARRIPALLNAICQTNFMTPIVDKITPVDQLDQMSKSSYVYGDNVDVVQLDLTIETIWLRRWTAGQTDDEAIASYKRQNPNDANFSSLSREEQVKYLKQNNLYNLGLMPDAIRYELGLPPRDPNFKPPTTGRPGMDNDYFGPGGPAGPGGGFPPDTMVP